MIFLSYILDKETPTYGNRFEFTIEKSSSIDKGDVANNSCIYTTTHIGTHLDMPYHFYENGQTITSFSPGFWVFNEILFLEIEPEDFIVENEVLNRLDIVKDKEKYELLIIKTGACNIRKERKFWEQNYGFSPKIAEYLKDFFPNIRIFGFDSISVSSFSARDIGRESHKCFLDPSHPILLLEDMDLTQIVNNTRLNKIIVCPLRIANCDGIPCTVFAEVFDED